MIQCMQSVAYAMLKYLCPLQSDWSSQIREWVRPSDKNVTQDTRPSLYTYVKVWAWDYSQMCYAVPGLCIWTVSSISIWSTLACLLTVKLEEHLSSLSLPYSSLSQNPLCPQFPWLFSHLEYSCVKLLHRQTSISLMLVSIQLLKRCLQFLLSKQQATNNGYMTLTPELGCRFH